jgi:2-polyprenyl-6-methoxyphenol hydroxylase-like FAD-dependent oxidoreductase
MQALTMEETTADVAIVGGGIAGGALPVRLARAGLAVTVLEQSAEIRDRVRGETVFPWGYAELVRSGLLDIAMPGGGDGCSTSRSVRGPDVPARR